MPNEINYLELFDIQHIQQFFGVVNHCTASVIFYLPDGQAKDLRFNFLVQNYLTWRDLSGNIPELKLDRLRPNMENVKTYEFRRFFAV